MSASPTAVDFVVFRVLLENLVAILAGAPLPREAPHTAEEDAGPEGVRYIDGGTISKLAGLSISTRSRIASKRIEQTRQIASQVSASSHDISLDVYQSLLKQRDGDAFSR